MRSWGLRSAAVAVAATATVAASAAAAPPSTAAVTPPAPEQWYTFAPYGDVSAWPPPDFSSYYSAAHVSHVTLAFVTAQGGTTCAPTWGGYSAYPASGTSAYQVSQIAAFRKQGGSVIVSFGGQTGTELAQMCPVSALERAYREVINAYGLDHVDFDIEGTDASNLAAAKRRATAVAALQQAASRTRRPLRVSLTLQVEPNGLTAESKQIVRSMIDNGVSISMVNGMAMDYGDSNARHPQGQMGTYAIDVAKSLTTQLGQFFPTLSATQVKSMVGVTPMIGINDTTDEIFTPWNAHQLVTFAKSDGVGMLSMWELGHDKQCPQPVTTPQATCSGVTQTPWQFARTLDRSPAPAASRPSAHRRL